MSLTANTETSQKPKFYIGDLVRIMNNEETIGKGYKQVFTDEVFKIASIPTLHPPTYSLFDANKEVIQGKFYRTELQLVRKFPLKKGSRRFEDEFTVYVISSASIEIFNQHTIASFGNFFNDEIQLSADWRVALSANNFQTEVKHVVNEDLIAYSLRGYEDSQKILCDANVIS